MSFSYKDKKGEQITISLECEDMSEMLDTFDLYNVSQAYPECIVDITAADTKGEYIWSIEVIVKYSYNNQNGLLYSDIDSEHNSFSKELKMEVFANGFEEFICKELKDTFVKNEIKSIIKEINEM